ncbi:unnamed protein product [Effrenium voratum]|nr:unnamed protein product [Effrenium voratum]
MRVFALTATTSWPSALRERAPRSVILGLTGLDGSVLAPPQAVQAQDMADIEPSLKPLPFKMKKDPPAAGFSFKEAIPVAHATDTYDKHRLRGMNAFSFVAGGFFQNNSAILPAFLQHVVNEASVDKPEVLVDLYCGVGLFAVASSRLKRFERIFGVEVDAAAIDLARRNGPSCTFLAADAARGLRRVAAELRPDQDVVVVVDPPRQGLRPEARAAVLRLKPKRLVYVSCDCATQARDLKAGCRRIGVHEVEVSETGDLTT